MSSIKDLKEIYTYFGVPNQVDKALEEMTELSLELYRYKKGKGDISALKEEIADVLLMVNQLVLIFSNQKEIKQIIDQKVYRTKKVIEDTKNTK